MTFRREFVLPARRRKWWEKCSECKKDMEPGTSCAVGQSIALCWHCIRILKEAMRP